MDINDYRLNENKCRSIDRIDFDSFFKDTEQDLLQYFPIFKELFEKSRDDFNLASLYLLLSELTSLNISNKNYSIDFEPYLKFEGMRTSIIDDFSDVDLNCIEIMIERVTNTELLARLSDVLWQRKKHTNWAEIAIMNYFESGKSKSDGKRKSLFYRYIERALLISLRIKSKQTNDIVSFIESIIIKSKESKDFRINEFAKLLINFKLGNLELLKNKLLKLAKVSYRESDFEISIQRYIVIEELANSTIDYEIKKKAVLMAVKILLKKAEYNLKNKNYLLASSEYNQAFVKIKKLGNYPKYLNYLNDKLVDIQSNNNKELSTIYTESIDPSRIIDESVNSVRGKETKDAIVHFALFPRINNYEYLEEQLKIQIKDTPLYHMFQSEIMDRKGRTITKIPGINLDDPLKDQDSFGLRIVRNAVFHNKFKTEVQLRPIFNYLFNNYKITTDDLKEYLDNNPFVPQNRIQLFEEGFYYCFKNEFHIGINLLIPQIENSIRNLLFVEGFNISTHKRDTVYQEDMNLTELLHTHKGPLTRIIGNDLLFDIEHTFNNKLSINIRNEVSHGQLNYQEFYSNQCLYVFWLIWRICIQFYFAINYKK